MTAIFLIDVVAKRLCPSIDSSYSFFSERDDVSPFSQTNHDGSSSFQTLH